jgi:molecular chaperone HscB
MLSIPTSAAKRDTATWSTEDPVNCWQCGSAVVPHLLCRSCDAIQPIPDGADYFAVLGLPQQLTLDQETLRQRYYELHRRWHPDLYQTGPQEARSVSLRNTAAVNRAYGTLRDPVERGEYWLTLHGERLGSNNNRVPPELAALVFAVQEKIEELRATGTGTGADDLRRELRSARDELQERERALLETLQRNFARWDARAAEPPALTRELKGILSELAYVRTLIRDVERALER